MIPDDLRHRLAAMRRPAPAVGAEVTTIACDVPSAKTKQEHDFAAAGEVQTPHGSHLAFSTPLAMWRDATPRKRRPLRPSNSEVRPPRPAAQAELTALAAALPNGAVLLDLETCGFAGAPIFLAGLAHYSAGAWTIEQLFARDYSQEAALLWTLWQRLSGKRVLATFNGKSFDWPMVRDRSVYHRLIPASAGHEPTTAPPVPPVHFDLLHHARRRWGQGLPNCRLQTLERALCSRRRQGDLPGRETPAAYHQFVRDGNAALMRAILHHNAWDLATLWELTAALAAEQRPESTAAA